MWWILLLFPLLALQAEITALYLSWIKDPTTTMTIQWHTPAGVVGDTIHLQTGDDTFETHVGEHANLEQILVHKVTLENLTPNTEYSFHIGNDLNSYRFRTAPDTLNEPLRFIIGGDVYLSAKLFRRMSKTVLENRPQFIVLGGDIAYAQGLSPFRSSALRRWISFLKDWKEHMITADGLITPFLIVPGNHDISTDDYSLFFTLFAFPKKQIYRAIDFGSYLSLILLDTGHFQPIEGRQTLWLDKALYERSETSYRFAVYHEAGYPSYYPYQGATAKKIRTHWTPLFEKHHILAAFENHNHAYKRTHPIKANQVDPSGVVYLGDGSWGAPPRKTNDQWYLAKKSRKNSVFLVELNAESAEIKALDLFNNSLDSLSIPPKQQY